MEKKSMNVYEFAGCNNAQVRPDGTKMHYREVFTKVVNAIGLERLIPYIPATLEQIQQAVYDDQYLNNIKGVKLDDWRPDAVAQLMVSVGITSIAKAQIVCTLKQAARMWAEQAKEGKQA